MNGNLTPEEIAAGYEPADCYGCGKWLTVDEMDRDKCSQCGRHYHDDQEDYVPEEDEEDEDEEE